jgi:hypothetical protein
MRLHNRLLERSQHVTRILPLHHPTVTYRGARFELRNCIEPQQRTGCNRALLNQRILESSGSFAG